MWTVYHAYSAVVDEVVRPFAGPGQPSGAELARVSALLDQASVVVTGPPPPLSRRRITDDGRVELTVAAAVARMDELFRGVAEVVTAAEAVWETAGARLDRIDAALAHRAGADGADPEPAVRQGRRLRTAVRTDPLARWRTGRWSPTISTTFSARWNICGIAGVLRGLLRRWGG